MHAWWHTTDEPFPSADQISTQKEVTHTIAQINIIKIRSRLHLHTDHKKLHGVCPTKAVYQDDNQCKMWCNVCRNQWFVARTGYPNPIPKFITRFQIRVTDTRFAQNADKITLLGTFVAKFYTLMDVCIFYTVNTLLTFYTKNLALWKIFVNWGTCHSNVVFPQLLESWNQVRVPR